MNRNAKGLVIGGAGGIGMQVGTFAHHFLERVAGDLPVEVDQAFIAIVAAGCAAVAYKWLPVGAPA